MAKNVSRMTARGLEEALIRQCQTLDPDKFYPRHNQIHGVSERNKNFRIYWDKAQTWLSENEVSCN